MKYRARYWMVRVQKIIAQFKSANPRVRLLAHSTLTVLGLLLAVIVARVMLETNSQQSVFNAQDRIVGVLQIILLAALPLAIIAYLVVDYVSHRKSLLQGKARIIHGYSVAHHIKVVNIPLFRYRFKDSFAAVAISLVYLCGFSGFLGYMIVRQSDAAPGTLAVTMNQKAGTPDPNPSYTSVFIAAFSESINKATFTSSDIALGGTAVGQQVQSITEAGAFDGTTFEVRIQASSAGTIQPSIIAESVNATNGASGTNQASTSADNTVTYNGSYSQDAFVLKVRTNAAGTSNPLAFTIPASGGNYDVDCNADGVNEFINQSSDTTCTYGVAGDYHVSITGTYSSFMFGMMNYNSTQKIFEVVQWGTNTWSGMNFMFFQASNLEVTAIDGPRFAPGAGMYEAFRLTPKLNQSLNHWDVSNVVNMNSMFREAHIFNQPLNNWNVGNVTNMSMMFEGAQAFNQPLSDWDVSAVTNMSSMFDRGIRPSMAFNQPLGDWDVSAVNNMNDMFRGGKLSPGNYDALLTGWSALTLQNTINFNGGDSTFCSIDERQIIITNFGWTITDGGIDKCFTPGAEPFVFKVNTAITNPYSTQSNQFTIYSSNGLELENYDVDCNNDGTPEFTGRSGPTTCIYGGAGEYEISISGSFPHMFHRAGNFGYETPKIIDILQWGDIKWRNMDGMFAGATSLTTFSASDTPDLSKVKNMRYMFQGASSFNTPLNNWDVSSVTDMENTFRGTSFNQPLNDWDVSSVERFWMTFGETPFNQPLNDWDVSSADNMMGMFWGAIAFDQPLNNWDVSNVTDMYAMFDNSAGLSTENYDATLASWSAQSLQSNVVFSAGDSTYCEAENERQSIIMNFSWTIEDVGKDCDTPDPTQQPLILKVRTDAPQGSGGGIDDSSRFNVRAGGSGSVFTVDCDNDGTPEFTNVSSSVMCDYSNHGQYEVAITGTYHHMDGKSGFGDNYKIVDIVQWGDLEWSSMDSMFYRAYNLTDISASDTPDLSQVTSVEGMFEEAESFNGNINDWDVSNVTNMRLMFLNATAFNQPLNSWDVSNVTDMAGMFASARSFNQPLNDWDVGSVTNTTAMFNGAFAFDSSLAGWDVSNVTSMAGMFAGAISFNQPLNSWNTGNVETMDSMFLNAVAFNQPLNSWDVSSVQNMRIMFAMASSFNQNINSWEVSSVTNMAAMFADEFAFTGIMMGTNDEPLEIGGTTIIPQPMSFNQPLNDWDVSNVSIMAGMFFGLRSFNQPLNDWDVSNVTNMGILFMLASSFNQPLNNWDVSNVTDFSFSGYAEELTGEAMDPDDAPYNFSIFSYALSFNSSVAGWDVSSARNTAGMFSGAKTFNQPLTNWNTTGVQNMTDMFSMTLAFDQPLDNLDVSQVTKMRTFLGGTDTLIESLELDAGMPIEDMPQEEKDKVFGLFSAFLDETVDQSNYQNFAAGLSTANYDATLANWNGQSLQNNVTLDAGTSTYCASSGARQNMISARNWTINDEGEDCDSQPGDRPFIIKVDTTFGDGSNQVTIPTSSTDYSYNYNVDCNNDGTPDFVDQTADVTCIYGSSGQYNIAISGVFPHWRGSGAAVQASIVDVVQWGDIEWRNMEWMFSDADELALFSAADDPDLSEVQSLSYMFAGADTFNADIQHWDVSNVTNMSGMFASVQSFNTPLNGWADKTGNVTNMNYMFAYSRTFNQPLNNWDVSNVTDFSEMFKGAQAFNASINDWNTTNATDMGAMFIYNPAFNQPLNNWDVSSATDMSGMFMGATAFDQSLASWDITSLQTAQMMFGSIVLLQMNYYEVAMYEAPYSDWTQQQKDDFFDFISQALGFTITEDDYKDTASGLSTANYDATLIGWSQRSLQNGVTFDAGTSTYCNAEVQRQNMIDTYGWTINDEGKDCAAPEPATTDMSLSTAITVPSKIQQGDQLSYIVTITNLGPNATNFNISNDNALVSVLPENTTFVSAVGTPAISCASQPATGSGAPFESLYAGRTMLLCSWSTSPQVIPVNSTVQVGLVLAATTSIPSGSNVVLNSLLLWVDDVDINDIYTALGAGEDVFASSINNASRYTLLIEDDTPTNSTNPTNPTNPVNPTNPGGGTTGGNNGGNGTTNPDTNVFDEGTTDDTIDIPTVEDIFKPDYSLDKPVASTSAKATWPTNIPFFFISLLILVALFYAYLALRDYMRARAALLLLARIKRDKDNILTFLEIISHYLGTPLSVLSGATELLTTKNVLAATTLTSLTAQINSLRTVVTTTTVNNNALLEQPTGGSIDGSDTSQILKSRQIWLPLVTIAGLIIIVDVSLMIFGGYELASLRTANVALFYILSAVGIVLTSYIMLKQKQLAERRALVIQQEQQLTTQQQSILSDVALQIQALYSKLYTSSQEFLGVAGTELYFNGLAMLGKLSRSLTNASTFAGPSVNPSLQPLSTVVRDVCTELQPLTDSKNINITSNVPDSLGIYASQDEARFLVWSLLENAVNFSPQSGSVNVTAVAGGNTIKLSVTDHGPGIPSDKIEDIFKPFMRASDTKEFDHEGLGLGLYTNKLLVEKLGGTLTITSSTTADTSGTTATLTLPKASQDGQGMSSSLIAPQTS